jgi:hypothetical protein
LGKEDRVTINGVPVQFIPVTPGLMDEALNKAKHVSVCGVTPRRKRNIDKEIVVRLHSSFEDMVRKHPDIGTEF